jgi:hypothetical protein
MIGNRRRTGRFLVAFGAIGLVLLAATAILVAVTLGGVGDAATGLERQRAQLVAMIRPTSASLRDAAAASQHAGASLTSSAAAARDGATLTTQLGDAMEQLNALSTLDILGTQPFASIGSSFGDLATRSRTLSTSLGRTADSLDADVADSATVSSDLGRLADQLDQLERGIDGTGTGSRGSISASAGFEALRLFLLALLAWLAVPAIASVWLGLRLAHEPTRA